MAASQRASDAKLVAMPSERPQSVVVEASFLAPAMNCRLRSRIALARSRVDELQDAIATLVHERQELRRSGASRIALERNRLHLVRSQWRLCQALIELHLPTYPEKAA
jgi:hypothetical protein